MRAIGISGSYRAGGVIDQTIDAVLEGAHEAGAQTLAVRLRDLDIRYCTNCRSCTQAPGDTPGTCVHQDDMAALIARLREADLVVVGSPMNVGQMTALTKTFEERLAPLLHWPWGSNRPPAVRRRPGGPVGLVTVASSVMPALLSRVVGRATVGGLRSVAWLLDATVLGDLCIGGVARTRADGPSDAQRARARAAGRRAVSMLPALSHPVARHAVPFGFRLRDLARETRESLAQMATWRP